MSTEPASDEKDPLDELYENRITVSPYTTVEMDYPGSTGCGSSPWGQRFCFIDQDADRVRLFDGPKVIGGFDNAQYYFLDRWGAPQVHPHKDLVAMISTYSKREVIIKVTVIFADLQGEALHSYRLDHGEIFSYRPAFGFLENGDFFYAGPILESGKEEYEIIVWDSELPIEDIGDREKAKTIENLGEKNTVIHGETQLQDTHYANRNPYIYNYHHKAELEIRPFWQTPEGNIELHPELSITQNATPKDSEALSMPICFSYDQGELLTTFPREGRKIRRYIYQRNPSTSGQNSSLTLHGEPGLWPCQENAAHPRNCFYIDPVRVIYRTESGRLFLLHTRSLVIEAEIELAGFELDTLSNQRQYPNFPPFRRNFNWFRGENFASDIDHIQRCGDYLLFIVPKGKKQTILGFVSLSQINNALAKAG